MAFTNEKQAATEGKNSKFITLTEGDDTFSNVAVEDDDSSDKPVGSGATIEALGGNDSVVNAYADVSISGGDDNDRIVNSAATVTLNAPRRNRQRLH